VKRSDGAGYLFNDDRANHNGVDEADILCCPHCQCTIKLQAWRIEGAFCHRCFAPVCNRCGKRMLTYGCENYMRYIDKALKEAYRKSQNAKVLGI